MCCSNTKDHALQNLHISPNTIGITEEHMLASVEIWIKERGVKRFDKKTSK